MNNERYFRRIDRLELMRQRAEDRIERERRRIEERSERFRRRLAPDESDPSGDQQRIITAALELLDENGLDNLSLRKLAERLDLRAPALYWYFKNKEVLIDYMAEAILRNEFYSVPPRRPDERWQEWLIAVCSHLRNAMLRHRNGARIVAGARLDRAITLMKLYEVSLQSLTSAGLELQEAGLIVTTAFHFVFGRVIEEQAAPSQEDVERADFYKLHDHYPLMKECLHHYRGAVLSGDNGFDAALHLIICGERRH
jgi:TetR/AcrR family transcriptional regulator, tetracycline repressor protein